MGERGARRATVNRRKYFAIRAQQELRPCKNGGEVGARLGLDPKPPGDSLRGPHGEDNWLYVRGRLA
jgi:hypothetical protein